MHGVAIYNMVISVNELPDGTAIADVSRELEKLRCTAHANPDSINWTLLVASTPDSAATQKRVNKLIEQQREDEIKFGIATMHVMQPR